MTETASPPSRRRFAGALLPVPRVSGETSLSGSVPGGRPGTPDLGSAAAGVGSSAERRDIQGLRAVAVVVVILDHLLGWPAGGFVGVDVFFVISGFVITSMLLREHRRHGRISFADFYRRRVRRILPVATLVLLVTVVAGLLLYLPARARTIEMDAVWAALFGANWHLAAAGTDYWSNDGFVSPLQHYWSLSVEEQFYLVWPVLLVGMLVLGGRWAWSSRRRTVAVGGLLALVVVASFGWALWESAARPTWAYFSTFSRTWELGVGALLAVAAPLCARMPDRARTVLGGVGLLGIVAAVLLLAENVAFPAPWGQLPVLATAAVIAAGTGGPPFRLGVLTNPMARYLGDISFSLYLWHFPVIVLLTTVLTVGPGYHLVAAVLILGLSVVSYHLVENPVRRSHWLDPHRPSTSSASVRRRRVLLDIGGVGVIVAVVAGLVVASLAGGTPLSTTTRTAAAGPPVAAAPPPATGPSATDLAVPGAGDPATADAATPATLATPATPAAALTQQLRAALDASEFPEFVPAIDTLSVKSWVAGVVAPGCADISAKNAADCATGDAAAGLDVAVLGDSFAIAWLPAIREAMQPLGWRVHPFTRGQCPAGQVGVTRDGGTPYPECDAHRAWAVGAIQELQPDLIIVADADNTLSRLADGAEGAAAGAEYRDGLHQTLTALTAAAPRTVVLTPPPKGANLLECVTRVSSPADCESPIGQRSEDYLTAATAAAEVVEGIPEGAAAGAAGTGAVEVIDTRDWFCVDGRCPGLVGDTPVRVDGVHLTVEYSSRLGAVLRSALLPT